LQWSWWQGWCCGRLRRCRLICRLKRRDRGRGHSIGSSGGSRRRARRIARQFAKLDGRSIRAAKNRDHGNAVGDVCAVLRTPGGWRQRRTPGAWRQRRLGGGAADHNQETPQPPTTTTTKRPEVTPHRLDRVGCARAYKSRPVQRCAPQGWPEHADVLGLVAMFFSNS
jgi:hypothetical protein